MTTPLGPAGALKIAYELIDAQAKHIKALERGHYGRDTRAAVQEKQDELELVQAAEAAGSCCAAGACDPCEYDPAPQEAYEQHEREARNDKDTITFANIEHARTLADEDHAEGVDHPEGAWPAQGLCRRCDYLQELWDQQQRVEAAARTRKAAAHDGDPTCQSECAAKHPSLEHWQWERLPEDDPS